MFGSRCWPRPVRQLTSTTSAPGASASAPNARKDWLPWPPSIRSETFFAVASRTARSGGRCLLGLVNVAEPTSGPRLLLIGVDRIGDAVGAALEALEGVLELARVAAAEDLLEVL